MNSPYKSSLLIRIFVLTASLGAFAHASLGQVTGTGTAGRIPVWTGATSQGNSAIIQSGSNIGIGTAAPASPLSVTSTTANAAILARDTVNGPAVWGIGNSGFGLRGNSTSYIGVGGFSGSYVGVGGNGPHIGVWGTSANGSGVYGAASGAGNGVFGISSSTSADKSGVYGHGPNTYGGYFTSTNYRGCRLSADNANFYSFLSFGGIGGFVEGDLVVTGDVTGTESRTGYAVEYMQNADGVALEQGDVVVIADNSTAPVLGSIPTPRIKLARNVNDTAVVGIVDRVTYVPDANIRAAYLAQQQADREASHAGTASLENDNNRISDAEGTVHTDRQATKADPGRYCSVVTQGAYKAVKVDASYGPINAGDLLTTSPHSGFAMRVQDRAAASGAVIGKALAGLASGTGTIPVLVTLR